MDSTERIFGVQSLLSKILIDDHLFAALIDSGAAISVLRLNSFEKLRENNRRLSKTTAQIKASAVNGSTLTFSGMSSLPCQWYKGSPVFYYKFFLVENLSVPCIVGFDLLQSQKCVIDFHFGFLDVGGAVLECVSPLTEWFEKKSTNHTESSICSVQQNFIVPPMSESLVPCTVSSLFVSSLSRSGSHSSSDAIVGLVEPLVGATSDMAVFVAATLVNLSSNTVFVRVLNPTTQTVNLFKKQSLAGITVYESQDIQISKISIGNSNNVFDLKLDFKTQLETLSGTQQESVYKLLTEFEQVFSKDKWDLGSCDLHKLKIQLAEGSQPTRVPYRAMNPTKRKELKEKISKLQQKDLIAPTHSEWAAPTILVPKKDGSYRLVVDYRKLNSQTVKTSWPLPRISDILLNLEGSCFFSSLDLCSGFHQMEIEEEDQHLTAFITPFGLYKWKRMPMGLCNAPGAFQRLMEIVLSGLTYELVLVYLDDIIVYGRNFEEHLERLRIVLNRIRDANLKISPAKCSLFQRKITFLGHVVSAEGIQTDPAKVQAVEKYPVPTTLRQVRAFMGLVGFYRKFIFNFGVIADPIYRLLNKSVKFHWTKECQQAFETLKSELVKAPILGFPTEKDEFTLCTDASLYGIGAVLSQTQSNGEKVIAFASKTLQKGQRNYSATKRELYAVVFFTAYFKEFLLGQKFKIITDHRALVWLYSFKDPDAIVARWLEKLSMFNFEIIHRPGKTITHADALSRIPEPSVSAVQLAKEPLNSGRRQTLQEQDPILQEVKKWLIAHERPNHSTMFGRPSSLQCYWQQFPSLTLVDDSVHRIVEMNDSTSHFQYCVPLSLVPEVLEMVHDNPASGHFGNGKTLARIRQRFYWPGVHNDVDSWVSGCEVCQKRKNPKQKHRQQMQEWLFSDVFHCVSVDILGPLPESSSETSVYRYILMIGDNFSRWFEAVPLINIKASTVCTAFMDSWVSRYGVPEYIHSDNGVQFTSKLFQDMCSRLQIHASRSTPYHPQGNAKVERINRTLEDGLAKYCSENHENWCNHLQSFMMAYRSALHESTGQSPFRLLFGREMRMPIDLMLPTTNAQPISHRDAVFVRLNDMSAIFQSVIDKNHWEVRRQKALFDRKKHGPTYQLGDFVLLHSPVHQVNQTPKLKSFWSGPYQIVKEINQINFLLEHCKTRKRQVAHYDRLKHYIDPAKRTGRVGQNRIKTRNKQLDTSPPGEQDNDLVLVELDSPEAGANPTSSTVPLSLTHPSSFNVAPSTSTGNRSLSDQNQNNQTNVSAPSSGRPVRAASRHARYPGFFRAAFFSPEDDEDFV